MLHAMCLMVTWFNLDTVMRGEDINGARDEGTRSLVSVAWEVHASSWEHADVS